MGEKKKKFKVRKKLGIRLSRFWLHICLHSWKIYSELAVEDSKETSKNASVGKIGTSFTKKRDPLYRRPDLDEPRPSVRRERAITTNLLRSLPVPRPFYLSRRLPERDYFPIRILSFEDK